MIKTKFCNVAVLAVAVFACVSAAHASLLPAGGAILTPPEPNPGVGIVVGSLVQPFTTPAGVGQYSGTLTTTVIQNMSRRENRIKLRRLYFMVIPPS